MKLSVNGEEISVDKELTVTELLTHIGLSEDKVMACAVDGMVVKKVDWDLKKVVEGQKIELLNFVGGG